jgi:hypothetical protein
MPTVLRITRGNIERRHGVGGSVAPKQPFRNIGCDFGLVRSSAEAGRITIDIAKRIGNFGQRRLHRRAL